MLQKKIKEIFIGSNNQGKIKEIADLLPKNIKIFSNLDFNISSPKETGKTFQQNSLLKARYFSKKTKKICLSDDSGIEVDILNKAPGIYSAEVMEDKNYIKQTQIESGEKPDYTFLLPKEKTLNMDVKFPLASYERYINAEREEERETQKKEFLKDVKNHIKEVAGREYVNPAEGTVDYVLLFSPMNPFTDLSIRKIPSL